MSQPRRVEPEATPPLGFVSLVGAGPGHPDFLTLKGLRRLQAAEVVLPDALLDSSFADLYPTGATVIPVGKRCGQTSTPQERIHRLLVTHAQAGCRVVRLKGGDPLIYGRGFEEAQALEAAGIPFEIISGVSSLQAGAAAAGLSLTHRGLADEFHVLEGHHLLERPRHWASLAQSGATLVLFMATRNLAAIAQKLLAHGAPRDLPVVLVEAACRPNETITRSLLAHAAAGQITARTNGPGILYLGATAGLRIPRHVHPDDLSASAALSGPQPFLRVAGGGR